MNGQGDGVARSFYLAQLQACKGSCKCNVCQLLRKSTDEMTEAMLKGEPTGPASTESLVQELIGKGYQVTPPEPVEERR